jgi:hypothetical protein
MKIGVLTIITILLSCSPMRKFEGIEKIHFGSGGGFTGGVVMNTLEKSGVVLKDGTEVQKLDQKQTSRLFAYTHKLKSDTVNEPGNMYHFIEFNDNGVNYRYVWSSLEAPNQDLNNWFLQLSQLVK